MPETYLSLGSNLGNRKGYIEKAEKLLLSETGNIKSKSALFETEPWGFHHPANFYNRVLLLETRLTPEELLSQCLSVERQLGRERHKNKYEARTIDIDILFYGDEIINREGLKIPHPNLHLRRFILLPFCEIAPERVHPILHKTMERILEECRDNGKVIRL
jgi:2-amino-4-hydroxy-6-hydroxymethyldihydropteridine diphosphokinase